MATKARQMAAGAFKARCLQVMDEVAQRRQPVLVTKRGKPVVRVVPVDDEQPQSTFGCLADEIEIVGDIESPVVAPGEWDALA